jgi:hypothetical protein
MELLESDDMKSKLLRESAMHKKEIEDDVRLISEQTEKIIINALVIGGSLALAYYLANQFGGSSKKKKKHKTKKIKLVKPGQDEAEEVFESESSSPGFLTEIGTALASQATVFLLNLAKEKLTEFLQAQAEKKTEE